MKEQAQAFTICRYLDEGAEHLPYRVSERLAAARAMAVARLPECAPVGAGLRPEGGSSAVAPDAFLTPAANTPARHLAAPLSSTTHASAPAGRSEREAAIHIPTPHAPAPWRPVAPARESRPRREGRSPLWWRLAVTAVPLLVLAVGVVVVDTVHQEQSAAELAEVDSALLTDDVPLVAYADRGFGVYIKNTRR